MLDSPNLRRGNVPLATRLKIEDLHAHLAPLDHYGLPGLSSAMADSVRAFARALRGALCCGEAYGRPCRDIARLKKNETHFFVIIQKQSDNMVPTIFLSVRFVNAPPPERRWLRVTAQSRVGPPFGGHGGNSRDIEVVIGLVRGLVPSTA
jgi:hypothetical protein